MSKTTFLAPLLKRDAPRYSLVTSGGSVLASHVELAGDSSTRRKGLLGRTEFPVGEALVIAPCNAVHTFFMKFPIDLVYVDRQGRVLKGRRRVTPWRMSGCLRAFATIELPAGSLDRTPLSPGDSVALKA